MWVSGVYVCVMDVNIQFKMDNKYVYGLLKCLCHFIKRFFTGLCVHPSICVWVWECACRLSVSFVHEENIYYWLPWFKFLRLVQRYKIISSKNLLRNVVTNT